MASFDEVIPPGQVGQIKATLKTDHGRGQQSKVVTVTTNDADQPVMNVILKADVVGSVAIYPGEMLSLTPFRPNARTTRLLVRKDETEQGTLDVKDVAVTQPWLKIKLRKVAADEPPLEGLPAAVPGDFVLEAEIDPSVELPPGQRNERVTFSTGLTREPTISIPVYVAVPPPIAVNPPDLILGEPLPDGKGMAGTAIVVIRHGLDMAGLQASAEPPEFHVALEPTGAQAYRARVSWDKSSGAPPPEGRVTFRLGSLSAALRVRVNASSPAVSPAAPVR